MPDNCPRLVDCCRGWPDLRHYGFDTSGIVRKAIVSAQFLIERLSFIEPRIGKFLAYVVDPFLDAGKADVTVIPAENIVILVCFTTSRFDEGDAGQKAPIKPIPISGNKELNRQIFYRTVIVCEEFIQECKARIICIFPLHRYRHGADEFRLCGDVCHGGKNDC